MKKSNEFLCGDCSYPIKKNQKRCKNCWVELVWNYIPDNEIILWDEYIYENYSNFFRKDLNLGKRWWHRLLSVIFFLWFFFCLFYLCKNIIFEWWYRPVYEVQSTLAERIPSEVKLISEFTNLWERIDTQPYWVNLFFFWFYWDGKYQGLIKDKSYSDNVSNTTYCSTQLYNQINEVIRRTGISKFYIKEINNYLEPISTKTTLKYIKDNNVQCIWIDRFDEENEFLNPWWVAQEIQNNYYFYAKTPSSNLLAMMNILTTIIVVVVILAVPFGILMLIYYKIILFVIFWSRNKRQ